MTTRPTSTRPDSDPPAGSGRGRGRTGGAGGLDRAHRRRWSILAPRPARRRLVLVPDLPAGRPGREVQVEVQPGLGGIADRRRARGPRRHRLARSPSGSTPRCPAPGRSRPAPTSCARTWARAPRPTVLERPATLTLPQARADPRADARHDRGPGRPDPRAQPRPVPRGRALEHRALEVPARERHLARGADLAGHVLREQGRHRGDAAARRWCSTSTQQATQRRARRRRPIRTGR